MADRRFRGKAEMDGRGTSTAWVVDDPNQTFALVIGCKMPVTPAD